MALYGLEPAPAWVYNCWGKCESGLVDRGLLAMTMYSDQQKERPNCFKCRHLVITWQMQRGYACRAMGFKSKIIPSLEVFRASGKQCQVFSPKPPKN